MVMMGPWTESEMAEPVETMITTESRLLQGIERAPERDAELAREVLKLNNAVRAAAADLGFDDQPTDFFATLVTLRWTEEAGR